MSEFEQKYYDLLNLVAKMRKHQKDFFSKHSSLDLDAAKKIEKRVDKLIQDEVLKTHTAQQSLKF